jgi:hypothetical protein
MSVSSPRGFRIKSSRLRFPEFGILLLIQVRFEHKAYSVLGQFYSQISLFQDLFIAIITSQLVPALSGIGSDAVNQIGFRSDGLRSGHTGR